MSDILSSRKPFESKSNEEWQKEIARVYGETVKFISIEQPDMSVDWKTRGHIERRMTVHCEKCNQTWKVATGTIRSRRNAGLQSHCTKCAARVNRQYNRTKPFKDQERIIELRSEGLGYAEIGRILNRKPKTIRYECMKLGLLMTDAEKHKTHNRKCIQIGIPFCECGQIVKKKGMLCDECRIIHKREADRRKETRRHRLRVKAQDKDITLRGLFERDNGICYLCGLPCNWDDCRTDDKGTFIVGRTYPTIEHVLPLCKGGTDTWNNIKLAHHGCNSTKGRRILEEHIPRIRTIGA